MSSKRTSFYLNISGGADVLCEMAKPLIDRTAKKVADRTTSIAGKIGASGGSKVVTEIGAANNRGGVRYYAKVSITGGDADNYSIRAGALENAYRSIKAI